MQRAYGKREIESALSRCGSKLRSITLLSVSLRFARPR